MRAVAHHESLLHEEEVEGDVRVEDNATGLAAMVDKNGLQKVLRTIARMTN